MKFQRLSIPHARQLILKCQGLRQSQATTLEIIQQLGFVQLDTLSVSERTHHHVLYSRNPEYQQAELHTLLAEDRSIFEYWSHAAAYLPIEAYRFSLFRKSMYGGQKTYRPNPDPKVMKYVLDHIRDNGPTKSQDLKPGSTEKGWWGDVKPTKVALEELFQQGHIMVSERKGFQKVYDLTARVLPEDIDLTVPTAEEMCRHLLLTGIRAQGVIAAKEAYYLRKGLNKTMGKVIQEMVEDAAIVPLQIEGIETPYYTLPALLAIEPTIPQEPQVQILSPFDNLIIQRNRALQFFDYEYKLECYTPEKKRRWGYFTLSILYGDRFVARFDPKADRKTGIFHVKKWWLEPGFEPTEAFMHAFKTQLKAFAKFCGCTKVKRLPKPGK